MRPLAVILIAVAAGLAAMQAPGDGGVRYVRSIELPRVEGRIDHLAFDAATRKLYVAALGNNTVEVLDVAADTHLRSLPGFREPQGIASIGGDVAVANGQGEGLQFLAAADGRTLRTTALGDDSDNVRFDAAAKVVYAGYGSGALAAVNAADGRVLGRVHLAGHPESFQLESSGPRVFVNVPSASQITVVDRKAMKVAATWPVATAGANYPMALDEAGHRLFVGCRRPAKVLVFDTRTGKEIAALDIVGDTDDMFYDGRSQRLFVIGGEGFLEVVDARQPATLSRVARIPTAAGARTGLYVAALDRLYVAVPHRGAQRTEVRIYETGAVTRGGGPR